MDEFNSILDNNEEKIRRLEGMSKINIQQVEQRYKRIKKYKGQRPKNRMRRYNTYIPLESKWKQEKREMIMGGKWKSYWV